MLDTAITIASAIGLIFCGLYIRFAPMYVRDRSKRYVKPRKRK